MLVVTSVVSSLSEQVGRMALACCGSTEDSVLLLSVVGGYPRCLWSRSCHSHCQSRPAPAAGLLGQGPRQSDSDSAISKCSGLL